MSSRATRPHKDAGDFETTPKIAIAGIETANTWQTEVSDNGPWVSEEEMEKLFKPFSRFSRSDTEGLGLGLPNCKKLMDVHNGRIWCEPGSGNGATFVLSFFKQATYVLPERHPILPSDGNISISQ